MEEQDIKDMIRKYERHDANFAWPFMHAMAELGLTGVNIPQEYGGQGADNLSGVLAMIEMSRIWAGGALILGVENSLAGYPIVKFGTDIQKNRWLPDLASGKILGCFGLTEPNYGSDAANIETYAELQPTSARHVFGTKRFITNAPVAKFIILPCRTDRKIKGHRGISTFVVEIDRHQFSGLTTSLPNQKLGLHAAQMGDVVFEKYPIFQNELLGDENNGFRVPMTTLNHGRNWIAAQCIGLLERIFELGLEYAKIRATFGAPLFERSSAYDVLSETKLASDISKLLLYHSAFLEDSSREFVTYASLAKFYASEKVRECSQNVQRKIFGGMGYLLESEITRIVADSLVEDIYEGSSPVQIDIILKAWKEGRLPVSGYINYLELCEKKRELEEKMGKISYLNLRNQRLPSKVARVLPLAMAWDLVTMYKDNWPKDFFFFRPEFLKHYIFDKIRLLWPSKQHMETEWILEEANQQIQAAI